MNKIEGINVNLIDVKITKISTKKEEHFPFNKYVVYTITFNTFLKEWEIKKRYKCFEQLHHELAKKVKNLPKFPEKRLFNFTEHTISERKTLLEVYLKYVLNNLNLINFPNLLSFIEIEKDELALLLRRPSSVQSSLNTRPRKSKSFTILHENFFFGEENSPLDVIENFLNNLEQKYEEKSKIVHNFWEYLKKQTNWPCFKREDILKLFFGNGTTLNGLLYHCGKVEENNYGADECIHLVANLLRYEFNPECEYYINVLKMTRMDHLASMNLESHLKSKKNNQDCFTILSVVLNEEKGINLKKVTQNHEIEEQFKIWIETQGRGIN